MKRIRGTLTVLTAVSIALLVLAVGGCDSAGAGSGGGGAGGGAADTTVTVTYVSGGHNSGNVPVDEQTYRPGDVVTVHDNTGNLARTDFVFSGWTRGSEGAVVNVAPGDTFTVGELDETLGARWELRPDADASAYTVGLYYYTEDATLTPTPFSVNGEYAGCVAAIGTENAVYVGEITSGSTHYLVARHPTGYYSLGLVAAWADAFEPQDVYIELDTEGLYVSFGDDPPAYTVPVGGWPSDCGGGGEGSGAISFGGDEYVLSVADLFESTVDVFGTSRWGIEWSSSNSSVGVYLFMAFTGETLPAGEYTFDDLIPEAPGTFSGGDIWTGFTTEYGVTGGTVTVAVDGTIYTFTGTLETSGGPATFHYSGPVDQLAQ